MKIRRYFSVTYPFKYEVNGNYLEEYECAFTLDGRFPFIIVRYDMGTLEVSYLDDHGRLHNSLGPAYTRGRIRIHKNKLDSIIGNLYYGILPCMDGMIGLRYENGERVRERGRDELKKRLDYLCSFYGI